MNKKNSKRIILYSILIAYFILNIIFIKNSLKQYSLLYHFIIWIILFVIAYFTLKPNKINTKKRIDTIQIISISLLVYFILYFLLGLIVGYVTSPYGHNFLSLLQNILPLITIIFLQEYVRSVLITKGHKSNFIIVTLLFTTITLLFSINNYQITSGVEIFKFVGLLLLPAITKNILLTYITLETGYIPSLLYRVILEVSIFLFPIFPNVNMYTESIIMVILPVLIMLKLNGMYLTYDRHVRIKKYSLKADKLLIPIIIVSLTCIGLVSGVFRYQIIAIVSNSMNPSFYRGDAVIMENITLKDVNKLKTGEVIIYRHGNIMIVHRIIKINGNTFITKGDNNSAPDPQAVNKSQVIGVMKVKIPLIGYPSVWLQENVLNS